MTAAAGLRVDPPLLELRGLTKRFGTVVACSDVDLEVRRGEIHGLLGENGAGKSTLMRMVIGLLLPDRGSILIDGAAHTIATPHRASELRIGMVHQEFSLVEALTVWENVALGAAGPLDRDGTRALVRAVGARYGLLVDADAVVGDLSAGLRQQVEIVKCLRHRPRLIILDEPTAVLTPAETEQLFRVLRDGVRSEGWGVILVSHRLDEVLRVTDRITVMRQGRVVDRVITADTDAPSLARSMVARQVRLRPTYAESAVARSPGGMPQPPGATPPLVLEVSEASLQASSGEVLLDRLSLAVAPGEIVAVAGVAGNGQEELAAVLSSVLALDSGAVRVGGVPVATGKAGAMMRAGVAVIPADRDHVGFVPEMSVAENLVLSSIGRFSARGLLQRAEIVAAAESLIAEFGIQSSPHTPVAHLSGGNRQRVVLARALRVAPVVLVAHQPTRGLDVGATEYFEERLQQVAGLGTGVLLISTDLDEVAALADRIVVIFRGAIVGEMRRSDLDLDRLGRWIGGSVVAGESGT